MKNNPILKVPILLPLETIKSSIIDLTRMRTVSIQARCAYHANAINSTRVYVYLSVNGDYWDTVAFTYFDVDVTAGAIVQKSQLILSPEHGYMCFGVKNRHTNLNVTDVSVWITTQTWDEEEAQIIPKRKEV